MYANIARETPNVLGRASDLNDVAGMVTGLHVAASSA